MNILLKRYINLLLSGFIFRILRSIQHIYSFAELYKVNIKKSSSAETAISFSNWLPISLHLAACFGGLWYNRKWVHNAPNISFCLF